MMSRTKQVASKICLVGMPETIFESSSQSEKRRSNRVLAVIVWMTFTTNKVAMPVSVIVRPVPSSSSASSRIPPMAFSRDSTVRL